MIQVLKEKLEMSESGAKGLFVGSVYNIFYYISLMLPMSVLYLFIEESLAFLQAGAALTFRYGVYFAVTGVSALLSSFLYYKQYNAVFFYRIRRKRSEKTEPRGKIEKTPLIVF